MEYPAATFRRGACLAALLLLLGGFAGRSVAAGPTEDLRALLAKSGPPAGTWGFAVADAETGELLYRADETAPRIPASTMKLVTSSSAVLELGKEFSFRTEIRAAAAPDRQGTVAGDLVVVGGGDPTLTAAPAPGAPDGRIEELVRKLAKSGVRRVSGDLVLDDSRFDRELRAPGWPSDQLDRSYCAPVGALVLEKNCVNVVVEPGAAPGAPARIRFAPDTDVLAVHDEMTTTAARKEQNIVLYVPRGQSTLFATGKVWTGCEGFPAEIAVPDPTAYFGDVLERALVRAGLSVAGDVVRRPGAGDKAETVLAATETPLFTVLDEMNRDSVNLYAECVLKTLGARLTGDGSFAAGCAVTARLADRIGAPAAELHQVDGSGLSRENRVSPRFLVRLLVKMFHTDCRLAFMKTLSVAGTDGTLSRRMKDLGSDVRAKTGTIHGVSALAGYVHAKSGRVLAFAFLENLSGNDRSRSVSVSRRLQDEICRILVEGY